MWFYAIGKLPLATAVTLNYMAPIWLAAWMFFIGWWHAQGPDRVAAGAGRGR
jgi:drug/metabolite transporter (DMT)-like permease